MLGARKIAKQELTAYATSSDFCRIFEQDMNRLYTLSFLLTADHALAERCFVGGLEDSKKGNPVFKEWAQSWARRMIVQNAIRMIRPRPTESGSPLSTSDRSRGDATMGPAEMAGIAELPVFERFAFVMSALEKHSDQECSLLLGCTRGEVIAGRTRALQHIAESELRRKLVSIDSEQKAISDGSRSRLQPAVLSPLAVSA